MDEIREISGREPPSEDHSSGFRPMAYLELVRLPNVFTAAADIVMGFLFTHPKEVVGTNCWVFGLLIGASCAIYAGGVALNDYFDRELDAEERPNRPIPSGRVSPGTARGLGFALLAIGVILGFAVAGISGQVRPTIVAVGLAGCVVLYDAVLKSTFLGPLTMGACRGLNVLLGMSVLANPWGNAHLLVSVAIGVYVVGVTWLARAETRGTGRPSMALASLAVLIGIGLLVPLPEWVEKPVMILQLDPQRWYLLLGFLGALTGYRCLQAVVEADGPRVQLTIKQLIFTLVVLDAAVCFVVRDVSGAIMVLVLLIPAVILGRWIYST